MPAPSPQPTPPASSCPVRTTTRTRGDARSPRLRAIRCPPVWRSGPSPIPSMAPHKHLQRARRAQDVQDSRLLKSLCRHYLHPCETGGARCSNVGFSAICDMNKCEYVSGSFGRVCIYTPCLIDLPSYDSLYSIVCSPFDLQRRQGKIF